jgi:hypothetical protein
LAMVLEQNVPSFILFWLKRGLLGALATGAILPEIKPFRQPFASDRRADLHCGPEVVTGVEIPWCGWGSSRKGSLSL